MNRKEITMKIEYFENGKSKSIEINPDHEAITIYASEREFAQVWIENKVNGSVAIVSGCTGVSAHGFMRNGLSLTKRTCRK
tara:strand:- start:759 stop:1001 length:243 start_codon:yes stop_codon:yes gene_type:complete